MKSNYFKYIFIIFAIAIMIFAIVKIKTEEQKKEAQVYEIKEEAEEEITEIKLGVASFDSINPILSKNKNVQDISKIIFEPLMILTSDYKLENSLAKEWAKQNETTYFTRHQTYRYYDSLFCGDLPRNYLGDRASCTQ